VGGREIGFLFGQYKRIVNQFCGVLTGKGFEYGGSLLRPEATGYGCVYFAQEMLALRNDSVKGKTALVSGSGNVAQYTVEKLNELGAKPITLSDFNGTIMDPDGIGPEKLAWVMELKNIRRGRIREYADHFKGATFLPNQRPWGVPGDLAFPSATQNEIELEDARTLVKNRCKLVAEGANMPTVPAGVDVFLQANILYGPGKAANAGGVATSGLEMAQNAGMTHWTREEVDARLKQIMHAIHANCVRYGTQGSVTNYVQGANIGGFVKVADAMLAQGVV
jgi:glutamate dehydrogenase (NADP+)